MNIATSKIFKESESLNEVNIDIDCPKSQMAVEVLPDNFQIRSMADLYTLQQFIAFKYGKEIKVYRGHESRNYKIESTIVRSFNKKPLSIHDIAKAEHLALKLFDKYIAKSNNWLNYKTRNTDEQLFKMSIGRHLGLPCRLIDVTASLEMAVWFAVMNPRHYNEDGEIILIVLDKEKMSVNNTKPLSKVGVSYSHEPFLCDLLDDLPLGEQRRFIQNGHFLWVDDNSLLNEQQAIEDAYSVQHYVIPWQAKLPLAIELYRDVYSGCAYQSEIEKIKNEITENYK